MIQRKVEDDKKSGAFSSRMQHDYRFKFPLPYIIIFNARSKEGEE